MNGKLTGRTVFAVALALSACTVQSSSPPPATSATAVYVQQQPPPGDPGAVATADPGDQATPMPQGDTQEAGAVTVQANPAPQAQQTQVQTGGGAQPVRCNADETVTLSSVTIDNPAGPAVQAQGNCSFTCTGCTLRGRPAAIEAHGNASVVLTGGTVTGDVAAHGNATVVTTSTQLQGRAQRHGNATITRN